MALVKTRMLTRWRGHYPTAYPVWVDDQLAAKMEAAGKLEIVDDEEPTPAIKRSRRRKAAAEKPDKPAKPAKPGKPPKPTVSSDATVEPTPHGDDGGSDRPAPGDA